MLVCLLDSFRDHVEDFRATSAVDAVLGAGGADAAGCPVVREGLVVDDEWREEGGMDWIEEVQQIAVIAS